MGDSAVKLSADIFSINPTKEYSTSYLKAVFDAKIEQLSNSRPMIMGKPQNLEKYDYIVLCYPIWWYTCPNIILSFLEENKNKLSNKVIIPVCTYGSSGQGHSLKDMKDSCPEANFHQAIEATAFKDEAVTKTYEKIKELVMLKL